MQRFDLGLERTFRSRVARRLFGVFVACALLPVTAFALFSFAQVSHQLERDARVQLRADAKAAAMSALERIGLLDATLRAGPAHGDARFASVALAPDAPPLGPATAREREHLVAGGTLLRTLPDEARPDAARILLVQAVPGDPAHLRVAAVRPEAIFPPEALRADVELAVRDGEGRLLAASAAGAKPDDGPVLRERFSLFLDSLYLAPAWTVTHLRREASVLAPLRQFRVVFPLVALLSLWVVTLLSVRQIRRRLVPIETLQAATRRIAEGDFDVRVEVHTDDEFRELGAAFDEMASRIGDLTRNLEARVAERTRQLSDALQELRATQAQLVHNAKMASIGRFVAGIAHELNNPIAFIEGNLHFLRSYADSLLGALDDTERAVAGGEPALSKRLAEIGEERELDHVRGDLPSLLDGCLEGVERSAALIRDLRSFSRLDDAERLPVDVNAALDSTLNVLRARLDGIEVVREYGTLPQVECLAGPLNQVWMNLLANAADAVAPAGRVVVRTADRGDGHVTVEVRDDGPGMHPEVLERIFDPFFTTKPVGSGTGLGLAVSWGVIQRHGGRIEVESEPGHGTCFRVLLPVAWRGKEAVPEAQAERPSLR